jgi:hypothetical protein
MPGVTAGTSRWALSAGTVLLFVGGLALYQMTSLLLGSAGSRQLQVSLALPAVANEDPSAVSFGADIVLGTLTRQVSLPAVAAPLVLARRPSGTPGAHVAVAPAPTGARTPATTVWVTVDGPVGPARCRAAHSRQKSGHRD